MTEVCIQTNGHASKKVLIGPELAAWSRKASQLTKLCIAAAIVAGELDLKDPTLTQVARILGVNQRRVNTAARLSDGMLDDIVDSVGANRMWAAIDRATMPKPKLNGNGSYAVAAE